MGAERYDSSSRQRRSFVHANVPVLDAGLITVDMDAASNIVAERERQGWRIFRLPRFIASKRQFFEGVRETLPLDPPLHGNEVWDALDDSLWEGLCSLSEDKIVILWPNAAEMKAHAADDFAIARFILEDLPKSLGDPVVTAGTPKQVLVILEI